MADGMIAIVTSILDHAGRQVYLILDHLQVTRARLQFVFFIMNSILISLFWSLSWLSRDHAIAVSYSVNFTANVYSTDYYSVLPTLNREKTQEHSCT